MNIKILHLNIERHKHIGKVADLLSKTNSDIVCFAEILESDIPFFKNECGYQYAIYSALAPEAEGGTTGSAVFSKFPIVGHNDIGYAEDAENITEEERKAPQEKGNRPVERFTYDYSILVAEIAVGDGKTIHVATTHFPVFDHATPGLDDHTLDEIQDVGEWTRIRAYTERLIVAIQTLQFPVIFTADLNSPRGEYTYNAVAHELVDRTPTDIDSTLDPTLHRTSELNFVVDVIMTSPDVYTKSVAVFDGVSDHKALLAAVSL